MVSIGIRVTPKIIYYSIAKKDGDVLELMHDCIVVPEALEIPRRLSYLRTTLFSLLKEFDVKYAAIRIVENISPNVSVIRLNIEGVIQELLADSTVNSYVTCMMYSFAAYLNVKISEASRILKSKENPLELPQWETLKIEQKEAILAALIANNLIVE